MVSEKSRIWFAVVERLGAEVRNHQGEKAKNATLGVFRA